MSIKQKQGTLLTLRTKLALLITASAGAILVLFLFFFGYFNTGIQQVAKASTSETFSSGSFLVNMGISPQTVANGLKPYGMIYDLNTNYNVPVKWVIEPTKVKDGNDFTHNGVNYRGGTFIIPAEYISATVASRIEYWLTQGVVGNYSVSSITVPVYMTITSFPRVMIDNLSGNDTIITKYFENASIPDSSYEINSPANLNACHDIWINPHGDPIWSTHQYLYDFVTVQKSFIWMQCHAVSMMEGVMNPLPPNTQLNYLTTNGLQCYQSAKCGTILETHLRAIPAPLAYYYPADPVMQFIGSMAGASSSGSERWFIPTTTGGWRATTKRLATVGSTTSPREGVIMVYGPAFGDTTNGLVMYTGGHDLNSSSAAMNVSAQRSFFNFLHLAAKSKAPALTASVTGNINANATDTFAVSVSGGEAPYTYSWSCAYGGTFSNPNDSVTTYTAFHTMQPWQTIITCVVTDACGRRNFFSQPLSVNASALPVSLISFTGTYTPEGTVSLKWKTGSETNNDFFTVARSSDGRNFTDWKTIPSKGNGTSDQQYVLTDTKPLAGTSYYRLSQTDQDGTKADIGMAKVSRAHKSDVKPAFTAGPNPFSDRLTINYQSDTEGTARVGIWNVSGRLIFEQKVFLSQGNNEFELEAVAKLPKGVYMVRLYNDNLRTEGIRVIKY